jgi:hypothetical protein
MIYRCKSATCPMAMVDLPEASAQEMDFRCRRRVVAT